MDVHPIRLPASNAHLVRVRGHAVLVDAGSRHAVPRLRNELLRLGVEPHRLTCVVLTHGHADHAGGARDLVGPDVPIVLGAGDAGLLERGRNGPLRPTGVTAHLVRPFVDRAFTPYRPDVLVEDELDLEPFGLPATARVVGGHTDGSLVVVGRGPAAGQALVGDLARGGYLGGVVAAGRPFRHYFSSDPGRDLRLLAALAEEYRLERVWVGHGGPLRAVDVALSAAAGRTSPRRGRGSPGGGELGHGR